MSTRPLTRRELLGSGCAAAALLIGPAILWQGRRGARRGADAGLADSLFRRTESARLLGRLYVARRPDEGDLEALMGRIAGSLGLHQDELAIVGRRELQARVRHRIRQDFASGAVVDLDGWRLAVTEARLCAVAALV